MAKIKAKKVENKKDVKKKKVKVIKEKPVLSEEAEQIKKFIIIFIVVCVLIVGIYVFTKVFVSDEKVSDNETVAGEVQYDYVSTGMILNRPYDNYYVMVYDAEDTKAMYYANLITTYSAKEDALKVYFCDLSNSLNEKYKSDSETGNAKATKASEFSFGKVTLIEVKNGKIAKYVDNLEKIEKILQ